MKTGRSLVPIRFLMAVAAGPAGVPPPDGCVAAALTIAAIPKPGHYQPKIRLSQGGEPRSIRHSITAR
jgi:hypothetical protein